MSKNELEKQDKNIFIVKDKNFERFKEMLDEPIPNAEKLKELLVTSSRWEKEEVL